MSRPAQAPEVPKQDQILVDEAALESFPASDPPAWTPTHAGGPARPSMTAETPRELRSKLRVDVERLVAERPEGQAEYVTSTLLDAGRHVVRTPLAMPPALENLEAVVRGAEDGDELVIGARYHSNASSTAVLLGLARVLTGRRFARTVRLVGFADGESGSRTYAKRLTDQRIRLRGMLSLDSVGFLVDREERVTSLVSHLVRPWRGTFVAFVGDSRSRGLAREMQHAFSFGTRLEARSVSVPSVFPLVSASDQQSFSRERLPAVVVTDTGPLRNKRQPNGKELPSLLNYDAMADVVFGLAAAIAQVAGGEAL